MEEPVDSEDLAEPGSGFGTTVTVKAGIPQWRRRIIAVHIPARQQWGFPIFFEELFDIVAVQTADEVLDSVDRTIMLNYNLQPCEAETHKQSAAIRNGKNIRITVPQARQRSQTIKLRGHGAPAVNGGPAGDLYITFVISRRSCIQTSGE